MDETDKEYYNLIATIGMTPAVVTEVIWKLAVHPTQPRYPASVTLICTYPGLLEWGKKMDKSGVWKQFCREVLDDEYLKPKMAPLTRQESMIDDISSRLDDKSLAAACFDLVSRYTEDEMLPLVASVAGGRKTMSSHLHAAMNRHGRRQDRLVHTLVARELEGRQDFYYPQTLEDSDQVLCVDIEFFPLRALLEHEALKDLLLVTEDRNTFVAALRSFQFTDPAGVAIYVGQHRYFASTLQFLDTRGKPQASGQLSPQNLATLLVLAQQIQNHGGGVTIPQLLTTAVQAQYRTISNLNRKSHRYVPWEDAQDVRSAVNRLNREIENNTKNPPAAAAYLGIAHNRFEDTTRYTWKNKDVPLLTIHCSTDTLNQARDWDTHFPSYPLLVTGD